MQETGNYKLKKPEGTDIVNIEDLNANSDIIDRELANKAQKEHTHSNYVNQNAFSNIKVGSTTIAADSTTDILTIAAGNNVTLTPDAANDKITISSANTVYTHPTTSGNKHIPSGGSSGQVLKWSADGTAAWGVEKDTVYTHPTHPSKTSGLYKVTIDGTGHVSAATAVTKADITNLGIPAQDTNTTYGVATTGALGLIKSGTDITVDSSGNVSVVDDSHNHVISNVDGLQSALDAKATASHIHSSYVNQNAFSNVKVGSTTIAADSTTDILTLEAGSNVTLTPDATNDKVTISATNTVYTHPTTSGYKHIPSGGSSGQILKWSASGTASWNNPSKELQLLITAVVSANSWTENTTSHFFSSGYSVPGMLEADEVFIDVVLSDPTEGSTSFANAVAQKKAWECIDYAKTINYGIYFYCFKKKPTTDLMINIWGLR